MLSSDKHYSLSVKSVNYRKKSLRSFDTFWVGFNWKKNLTTKTNWTNQVIVSEKEKKIISFHWKCGLQLFRSTSHFINKAFHRLVFSSTTCFINLCFHWLVVSSTNHFLNTTFHQPVISSTRLFINLCFHRLVVSSTCVFID